MGELVRQAEIMKYFEEFDAGISTVEISDQRKILESVAVSAEDKQVLTAYKALEEGRKMVSLSEAIIKGGTDSNNMPKIGIARADMSSVRCASYPAGTVRFFDGRPRAEGWSKRRIKKENPWKNEFPGLLPKWTWNRDYEGTTAGARTGNARAPYIPPHVRPENSADYLVFWEAQWSMDEVPKPRPRVVIDPAILEQVVGDLYMVVATWDLTPIEAAALD